MCSNDVMDIPLAVGWSSIAPEFDGLRRPKVTGGRSARSVGVAGQSGAAAPLPGVDRHQCRDQLAGDQTVSAGELVDNVEAACDSLRCVDDDRCHRYLTPELNQLVAVWFMVAVVSPDAAQHGGAARGARLAELADDRAVNG